MLIDEDCKPWLIEVNQSPSFKADSGLDRRIKEKLVTDTLTLLNLSAKRKQRWIAQNKQAIQKRMITGKKVKLTQEERDSMTFYLATNEVVMFQYLMPSDAEILTQEEAEAAGWFGDSL